MNPPDINIRYFLRCISCESEVILILRADIVEHTGIAVTAFRCPTCEQIMSSATITEPSRG